MKPESSHQRRTQASRVGPPVRASLWWRRLIVILLGVLVLAPAILAPIIGLADALSSTSAQLAAAPATTPTVALGYVGRGGNIRVWEGWRSSPTEITKDGRPRGEGWPRYSSPNWSPDGRILAFTREDSGRGTNPFSVYTWDASSGDVLRLTMGEVPIWSPDGSKIAYDGPPNIEGEGGGSGRYSIFDRASGRITPIADSSGSFASPSWSPDGAQIIFSTFSSGVVIADSNTGQTMRTFAENMMIGSPLWSPNGKYIAAVAVQETGLDMPAAKEEVILIDVSTGETISLKPEMTFFGPSGYGSPERWGVWSNDSSQLFFTSSEGDIWVWQSRNGKTKLVAPDGSAVGRLGLDITQSGRWLAYAAATDAGPEVVVYDLERAVEVARIAGDSPVWQPQALPPVMFVHGCGGGLATWTDPGWITDTQDIAKVEIGSTSGRLHRGMIPGLPAVPAYALDYGGSSGTVFALAGLLPRSIDKILEETGSEEVMLVTHSMGGVLAQAYAAGLALGDPFDDDVAASFMVAPPSRGAFVSNWLTGQLGDALACPQASELGPNSETMARLRAALLPEIDYAVVSGTRFWLPFVGLNDGIVADADVGLSGVAYNKRQVRGTHADVPLLPNTIGALCSTVLNDPCTPELKMEEVKDLFHERYVKDMFE